MDEVWPKIRDQARYTAEEAGSPANAGRWLYRVLEAVGTLEHWPRRCPEAVENAFFPFEERMLIVDGFILWPTTHA